MTFDDLPYRVGFRIKRTMLTLMGPPQLSGDDDPRTRMDRERAERAAARAARRGGAPHA